LGVWGGVEGSRAAARCPAHADAAAMPCHAMPCHGRPGQAPAGAARRGLTLANSAGSCRRARRRKASSWLGMRSAYTGNCSRQLKPSWSSTCGRMGVRGWGGEGGGTGHGGSGGSAGAGIRAQHLGWSSQPSATAPGAGSGCSGGAAASQPCWHPPALPGPPRSAAPAAAGRGRPRGGGAPAAS
jgi:hypothetical protein